MVAFAAPVVAMMAFAYRAGEPVATPGAVLFEPRFYSPDPNYTAHCVSSADDAVNVACCQWRASTGPMLWIAYAAVVLSWAVALASELRQFAVSVVVARWYKAPVGVPLPGYPVCEALRLAGPNAGSLAKGAAVLTAVEALRSAAKQAQRKSGIDFVAGCFMACFASIRACRSRGGRSLSLSRACSLSLKARRFV